MLFNIRSRVKDAKLVNIVSEMVFGVSYKLTSLK